MKKSNRYFFGLGTIGRDMFYSIVTGQLLFFLTDIVGISQTRVGIVMVIFTVLKIFDALNDPISGMIVDNTRSKKYGKFKPWMAIGMIVGALFALPLFIDFKVNDILFGIIFTVCYLGFDFFYGLNDTAYWGMLPTLSSDNVEREKNSSFARNMANVGAFLFTVAFFPLLDGLIVAFGGNVEVVNETQQVVRTGLPGQIAILIIFGIVVLLLVGFQLFTLLGVKEKEIDLQEEKITLKDVFKTIAKNDQLLVIALSMLLFMTGYMGIVGFGAYYAKYIWGDAGFYSIFAAVLGIGMLLSVALSPTVIRAVGRKKLFTISSLMMVVGCGLFLIPVQSYFLVVPAGLLTFMGQGFISVLMLVSIQDTVEYGDLKFGKRNEAVTIAVQSFINKGSGALGQTLIVTIFLLISGITAVDKNLPDASASAALADSGKLLLKLGMFGLPILFIIVSYFLYTKFFHIDEKKHDEILAELKRRNEVIENEPSEK